MEASNGTAHEGNSCGISKIIDVKIGEGGRQVYKVKWEPTWEPAENLVTCQHLINEFWSFVNKAKANEAARLNQKRKMMDPATNNPIKKLSEDNKAEVQRLIARTNATAVGSNMPMLPSNSLTTPSNMLMSPSNISMSHSNMLIPPNISMSLSNRVMSPSKMPISSSNQQTNIMGIAPQHGINQNFPRSPQTPKNMQQQNPNMQISSPGQKSLSFNGQQNVSSPIQKGVITAFGNKTPTTRINSEPKDLAKIVLPGTPGTPGSNSNSMSNTSTLKYIENFSNPYVKIILVCVICNKEQSLKFAHHWKRHYLSHASDKDKPQKCHICPKAFVEAPELRRHLKSHEKKTTPKMEEQFAMY